MAGRRVFVRGDAVDGSLISFAAGGPLANLTESSAVCSHGGSVVHATVASKRNPDPSDDFLPLTVDYRSRSYAFGRIPSTNNRRERHGNDEEVLVARMIDRAVRPLFPPGFVSELHLTVTTHAADGTNDPTVAAVNAASLALLRSRAPWAGPVGCVRVGYIAGRLVVSPSLAQMAESTLDFVYAGTEQRPVMLECVAKEVPEEVLEEALRVARSAVGGLIAAQQESLILAPPRADSAPVLVPSASSTSASASPTAALDALLAPHQAACEDMFRSCAGLGKADRSAKEGAMRRLLRDRLDEALLHEAAAATGGVGGGGEGVSTAASSREAASGEQGGMLSWLGGAGASASGSERAAASAPTAAAPRPGPSAMHRSMSLDGLMSRAFRSVCLEGLRADGREPSTVRAVSCHLDVLPEVHGSAFFCRGDTHVLCTATLGPLQDARLTYALSGVGHAGMRNGSVGSVVRSSSSNSGGGDDSGEAPKLSAQASEEQTDTFFLHYDFPPYCTGETGSVTGVNRRMIGHGNLADRAVRPLVPPPTSFPYTVRAYAECTSSNGSSSMAAVAGVSLALADAGVPMACHVAGVSVGLVTAPAADGPSTGMGTGTGTGTTEGLRYRLLTDLTGTEDYYGDMDFKIAGTRAGVTAMQLDVKLAGGTDPTGAKETPTLTSPSLASRLPRSSHLPPCPLPPSLGVPIDCLVSALHAARLGRLEILDRMDAAAPIAAAPAAPRLKPSAPRAEVVIYDPERRRLLLGPGGEMMRYVEATYQCQVDTREEGRAYIFGADAALVAEARDLVQDLVGMVSVGSEFLCEVLDIKDFGLMVKLNRAQEALLHMSELTHDLGLLRRPLGELVQVGQRLRCVVITVEKGTGLVRVSRKRLLDEGGGADGIVDVPPPAEGEGRIRPIGDVPVFPVVPPRKWSKEYFRHNISGDGDMNAKVKSPSSSWSQGPKDIGSSGASGEATKPREGSDASGPPPSRRPLSPPRSPSSLGPDRDDRRSSSQPPRSGGGREPDRGPRDGYRGPREGYREGNRGDRDINRSRDREPQPRSPVSRDAAPRETDLASIVLPTDGPSAHHVAPGRSEAQKARGRPRKAAGKAPSPSLSRAPLPSTPVSDPPAPAAAPAPAPAREAGEKPVEEVWTP